MSKELITESFIETWLKKGKEKWPDSSIIQAVADATTKNQLDETSLLKSLKKEAMSEKE